MVSPVEFGILDGSTRVERSRHGNLAGSVWVD
jgi:hypothetical protein